MVAIVSGNALGLSLGSWATLGQQGSKGSATTGRNGELAYVNAATGNLVLQDRDELLVGRGLSTEALRTYNSRGLMSDDNGDNWSVGIYAQQLRLEGSYGATGSAFIRTSRDGAQARYAYDPMLGRYVTTDGGGAHDTIQLGIDDDRWVWTDGTTGLEERYDRLSGRLERATERNGAFLHYAYDAAGRLQFVSVNGTEATHYDYQGDLLQQVRTVTDGAEGDVTMTRVRYRYDALRRLESVTVDLTPDDNSVADGVDTYWTVYGYDGDSKRIASVTQKDGTGLAFEYDATGRVKWVSDALGQRTGFDYKAGGRTEVTSPLGLKTWYDHDAQGRLTAITSLAGTTALEVSRFAYNNSGDVIRVTDGTGRAMHYEYDERGNQKLQRDGLGNTIARTFDARNQLVTETLYVGSDPDGNGPESASKALTTRHVYDAAGRSLRFVISAEGRVTEHVYDGAGQRTATIAYTGASYAIEGWSPTTVPTEEQVDAWARAERPKRQMMRTDMAYDARGQLRRTTVFNAVSTSGEGLSDGEQAVTHHVFDAQGLLRQTIAPGNRMTSYAYDGLGRLTAATDAHRVTTLTIYDDAGNLTHIEHDNGLVTTSAYDRAGLLMSVMQADGAGLRLGETRFTYDSDSRLRMTEDPTGRRNWMLYDGAGRKTADIDGDGSLVEYIYDGSGRIARTVAYATAVATTALADPAVTVGMLRPDRQPALDLVTWRLYDAAGRLTKTIDGSGAVTETTYDGASRVSAVTRYAQRVDTSLLSDPPLPALPPAPGPAPAPTPAPPQGPIGPLPPGPIFPIDPPWGTMIVPVDTEYTPPAPLGLSHIGSQAPGRSPIPGPPPEPLPESGPQALDGSWAGLASVSSNATTLPARLATIAVQSTSAPGVPTADPARDRTDHYFYDDDGLLTKEVNGEGHVTEHEYDAAGRRTVTLRRGDASTPDIRNVTLYNSQGRIAADVDGENFLTEYVYDRNGNLHQQVRYHPALAGRIEPGTPLASIRPTPGPGREQQVTTWDHDELNRVKQMTDAQGTVTTYDYDRMGRLRTTTRAVGTAEVRAVNARYDLQGRLVGELSGEGSALLTGDLSAEQIEDIWVKHGLKHEYDEAGRRKRTLDCRVHDAGVQTLYFYDADGRLERTVNPLGEVEEWHYNGLNQLELNERHGPGTTDRASTRLTYDNQGLLDSRTVALEATKSATTRFDYNSFGEETHRVTDLGDGRQRTDRTEHDRRGLQTIATVDEGGLAVRTESHFDAFGRRHTFVDGNGQSHVQHFDRLGRVVQTIDALGNGRSTSYDAFDRVLTQTDALNHTTTYTYDTALRSMVVTTPENVSVKTVRTRHGESLSITDGEGHTTTYQYDHDGRLTDTYTPITGIDTHQRFDRAGRLVKTIDGNDNEVHYEYDDANRVLYRRVDPAGLNLATGYKYDGLGRQYEVTDPNGTITRIGFDLAGRVLTQTVDPDGLNLKTVYTRDAAGNVLTVDGPGGRFTQYVYDKLGRRTEEHVLADPAKPMLVTRFDHDDNGNVVGRTDAEGHHIRFAHDAENRLLFSVDALGNTIRHEYDDEGRLQRTTRYAAPIDISTLPKPAAAADILPKALAIAQPGQDMVDTRRHDQDGRLRFQADGTGAVLEFKYDDNGNVIERIAYAKAVAAWDGSEDPVVDREDPLNQRTRTDYDQLNRATHLADAMGTVTARGYDKNGNLLTSTRHARSITALQRPKDVTPDTERDRTDTFEYDKANRQTWHADATGSVTEHAYDDNGNVKRLTRYARRVTGGALPSSLGEPTAADRSTQYIHDKAGRRTHAVDAMNFVDEWTYKGDGTLLTHTRFHETLKAGQAAKDIARNELRDRTERYVHDAAGRLSEHTDASGATEKFGYDGVGHKTSFTDKRGHTWNYEYDAAGRLERQRSPLVDVTRVAGDDTTRLLVGEPEHNVRIVTFMQYDALGRLTARTDAEGRLGEERTTRYGYDAAGRQVSVTYPEVGVYDILLDAPDTGPGVARLETRRVLQSRTLYDALGNAVANVDAAGHVSLKVHDLAGRVIGEIDALGYATRHLRNAFGEVETTVRHAAAIEPEGSTPEQRAAEAAALLEAHAAAGLGSGRRLDMRYDAVGRVISVKEPQAYNFVPGSGTSYASKLTTNEYDTFGDLRVTREGSDAEDIPTLATYHYHDALGRRRATVDAMGYLTIHRHDAAGNVESSTEFSTKLSAGQWNADGFDTPSLDNEHDRTTSWTYDGMNRKRTETRHAVRYSEDAGGTTKTGHLVTEYHYDANGNLTQTTDQLGASVFTHYDALGRVIAVVSPQRQLADGTNATPLTVFLRDAHGNAVAQLQPWAGGSGPTSYAPSDKDRVTVSRFDALNREVQRSDAEGANHFSSYNAQGLLGKTWQRVSNLDDAEQTVLTLFRGQAYDALGRITHVYDPAPFDEAQRAGSGMVDTVHEYNAFGELTKKYVAGTPEAEREYHEYDAAGRLWRSNGAGGIDRIHLHDALGRQTAEIVSNGEQDLRTLAQDKAASAAGVRITETRYDALGRAVMQTLPARELEQKGVTVRREITGYEIKASEEFVEFSEGVDNAGKRWEGENKLELTWTSLKSLGAGDVKVEIKYETRAAVKTPASTGEFGEPIGATYYKTEQRSLTRIISSDAANEGATLIWHDDHRPVPGEDEVSHHGISIVRHLKIWKQDALGEWRQVADQTSFGASGHTVTVALPQDPKATVLVEIREPGGAWTEVTGINFGSALWFDARGVTLGSFDYRVSTTFPGIGKKDVASGTLTMTTPELSALPAPAYDADAPGLLAWTASTPTEAPTATGASSSAASLGPDGVAQVFNYRAGHSGPWTSLPIVDRGFGGFGVETSWLPGGTYEYELLRIDEATGVPTAHATGTFTVTPASADATVPTFRFGVSGFSRHYTGLLWADRTEPYDQVQLFLREIGSGTWREAAGVLKRVAASSGYSWEYDLVSVEGPSEYDVHVVFKHEGRAVAQSATHVWFEDGRIRFEQVPVVTDYNFSSPTSLAWTGPTWDEGVSPTGSFFIGLVGEQPTEYRFETVVGPEGRVTGRVPFKVELGSLLTTPGTYEFNILHQFLDTAPGGYPNHWSEPTLGTGFITVTGDGEPLLTVGEPEKISGFALRQGLMSWASHPDTTLTPTFEVWSKLSLLRSEWENLPVTIGADGRSYVDFMAWYTPLAEHDLSMFQEFGPEFRVRYRNAEGQTVALGSAGMNFMTKSPSFSIEPIPVPGGEPANYATTSNTDTTGPYALSLTGTNLGYLLHQDKAQDGYSNVQRPTLIQEYDRWGNVLSTNDPRSTAWKTTFDWNHNNQLIRQVRPNSDGGKDGGSITEIYYDQLGRQVAVRDAKDNVNGTQYDAAGLVVKELHADAGYVTHGYDIFGRRVQTTDAQGNFEADEWLKRGSETSGEAGSGDDHLERAEEARSQHTRRFAYDKLDRLLAVDHGKAYVYRATADLTHTELLNDGERADITETFVYDEAGRQLKHINGNGEHTLYRYDLAGRIVHADQRGKATAEPGVVTTYAYDAHGHKTRETNALGDTMRWAHDAFGRVTEHVDLGGATITYDYDAARQLVLQESSRGQKQTFRYDGAGQLLGIEQLVGRRPLPAEEGGGEAPSIKTTRYAYDLAGNRVHERTEQDGVVAQDNYIAYDALGRMRHVFDGRVNLEMDYDLNGNRTVVKSSVRVLADTGDPSADALHASTRTFRYDAMNRQTFVGATEGLPAHTIEYDKNGNRIKDSYVGNSVTINEIEVPVFGSEGEQIFTTSGYSFDVKEDATITETYHYDTLNRLQSVVRDNVQVDYRQYDGAGRVVRSGTPEDLPPGYAEQINAGRPHGEAIGLEKRVSRYDDWGRLKEQKVFNGNAGNLLQQHVQYTQVDRVGNVKQYKLDLYDDGDFLSSRTYTGTTRAYEGYVQESLKVDIGGGGTTRTEYDLDGNLRSVTDDLTPANNRSFITDAQGRVLLVSQGHEVKHVRRQLIVNGESLGDFGIGPDHVNPLNFERQPNFAPTADFSFGYQPISGNYPGPAPGVYTVRQGDSLQSIARAAYGDSQLWYRIADANGLTGDHDLRVGQSLSIPAGVGTIHNDSDTFEPYDPSRMVGDTTPSLPFHENKCRALSTIIAIVVTIVVTAATGGNVAYGAMAGDAARQVSSAIVNGRFDWKDFAKRTAIGATLGPVTGDIYMGKDPEHPPGFTETEYDWKSTAIAGASAFAGQFVGGGPIVQRAVSNIVSQQLNRRAGRQQGFSWEALVASAIGLPRSRDDVLSLAVNYAMTGEIGIGPGRSSSGGNGPGLTLSQDAVDGWGPQYASGGSALGPDYSLVAGGVRLGTGDPGGSLVFDDLPPLDNTPLPRTADGRVILPSGRAVRDASYVALGGGTGATSAAADAQREYTGHFPTTQLIESRLRAYTPNGLTKVDGSPVTYSFDERTGKAYWNLGVQNEVTEIWAPYRVPTMDEARQAPGNAFALLAQTDTVLKDLMLLGVGGGLGAALTVPVVGLAAWGDGVCG